MKLLLAGLFVCVAVGVGVSGLDALGLLELRGPLMGLLMALNMTAAIALAWWIFREREPVQRPAARLPRLHASVEAGGRLLPNPRLDFRFEFVTTHRDLLNAQSALRRENTGVRSWVAGLVVALGLLWLVAFADFMARDFVEGRIGVAPVAWLVSGSGILWFFLLRPLRERRALRSSSDPSQALVLTFDRRGLEAQAAGLGVVRRAWSEICDVVLASKGVLLVLANEWHWLPARAFANGAHRAHFVELVAERIAQEVLRSEAQPEPHPILLDASDHRVVSVRTRTRPDPEQPYVDLTLRRGESVRQLRFLRVTNLDLDAEAIQRGGVRVQVLALPFPELEGAAVSVFEVREEEEWDADEYGFPSVSFDAEEVVDLDQAGRPPPQAAAPALG